MQRLFATQFARLRKPWIHTPVRHRSTAYPTDFPSAYKHKEPCIQESLLKRGIYQHQETKECFRIARLIPGTDVRDGMFVLAERLIEEKGTGYMIAIPVASFYGVAPSPFCKHHLSPYRFVRETNATVIV
jgi:hypothetical protein